MNLKVSYGYVQSKYVSKCIKKDNKYFIVFKENLEEVEETEIDRSIFCQIPGTRLIPTLESESQVSITTNIHSDERISETLYFEQEDTIHLLNLNRIVQIRNSGDVWLIEMEDETLWFKSFHSNFKHVINQLRK